MPHTKRKYTGIGGHPGKAPKFKRGPKGKGLSGSERVYATSQPPLTIGVSMGSFGHKKFRPGHIPFEIRKLKKKLVLSSKDAALLNGLIKAAEEHNIKI